MTQRGNQLMVVYRRLFEAFGPQHWWPGETPFEVIIGAILTQSTAWTNVEKAIANLKAAGVLSAPALHAIPQEDLAKLVRPAGYFNAKAAKIKAFITYLQRHGFELERLFSRDIGPLREELLEVYGVGEETADSIILYAGGKPSFVIDAYTRRVVRRLGFPPDTDRYESYRDLFQKNLPADPALFNEYHALLVRLGKDICRKREPLCGRCPLSALCATAGGALP